MKRREALNRLIIGVTTLLIIPSFLNSCEKDENIDPGNKVSEVILTIDISVSSCILNTKGGYIIREDIIVINTGEGNFVALSGICTHCECTLSYDFKNNNLPCRCNGSVFSTSGGVLKGPASKPLTSYNVSRDSDILTITQIIEAD